MTRFSGAPIRRPVRSRSELPVALRDDRWLRPSREIFATLSLVDLKILGVGTAAAVLIDATVVRGERAWSAPLPAPSRRVGLSS
jgi:hypothetical protein